MKTLIIASAVAVAVTAVATGSALACPHGYKKVKVQGNSVCQLDAAASDSLKASTKPTRQNDIISKLQVGMRAKSR